MSQNHFRFWLTDKAIPFLKALGIVGVFSPWLIVAYSVIAPYTAALDENDREVIKGFIEWFGTAYSFFLALAIVNVWSQFETVERELDRELDAVSTLLQTVKYTETSGVWKAHQLGEFKESVRKDIKKYITHVVKNYKFEHLVSRQHQNGDRILESIGTHISTLASNKVVPEPFVYELFNSLNEATDVRGDRISHSKPYTPVIIKLVALIASIIWLVSFLGLVIYDEWVTTILIGGVSFIIIMILVIFFDLGEPFGGIWKIRLDDWSEFLHNMDHASDPEVIFIYNLESTMKGQIRSWIRYDTCNLYKLAHSGFFGISWKRFLKGIQSIQPNVNVSVRYLTVYSNDLGYQGLQITCKERPLVILEYNDRQIVLVKSQEINGCKSLAKFEELFNQRMREHLS